VESYVEEEHSLKPNKISNIKNYMI